MQSVTVRLKHAYSILRFSSFDTSHPGGRAQERHRRVALTGIAAAAAKIIAVSTSLVTIPMTLHYLGSERFGLWMTVSSVVAILNFADFGIGNGVLNAISEANGKDDVEAIREYIASGALLLSTIAACLLAIFLLVYRFIPFSEFFNVRSELAVREAGPAMAVFCGCFLLNIPLGIVQRIQLGLQEGFISNLWQLFGSLTGLLGIIVVIHFQAGLPWLVLALAGAPVFAMLVNGIIFFTATRPNLRPKAQNVSQAAMNRIAHIGMLFFVLQLAVAMAYSSDNVIAAQVLGPDAVTRYSITAKMFSMISVLLAMFLGPLWPAYGEAISRGDLLWVRKTLFRSLFGAMVIAGIGALTLVLLGPWLLKVWVHRILDPPFFLLLGLGLWAIVEAGGSALAMFLNGANIVGLQVTLASIFAVACLTLKIALVRRLGIVGIPWATLISYICCTAIPCAFLVPRILNSLHKRGSTATPVPEYNSA